MPRKRLGPTGLRRPGHVGRVRRSGRKPEAADRGCRPALKRKGVAREGLRGQVWGDVVEAHRSGRKRGAAGKAHHPGQRCKAVVGARRSGRKRGAAGRVRPPGQRCKAVVEARRSGRKRGAADRVRPPGPCKGVEGPHRSGQGRGCEGVGLGLRWVRRLGPPCKVVAEARRRVRLDLEPKAVGRDRRSDRGCKVVVDGARLRVFGLEAVDRARLPVQTPERLARARHGVRKRVAPVPAGRDPAQGREARCEAAIPRVPRHAGLDRVGLKDRPVLREKRNRTSRLPARHRES